VVFLRFLFAHFTSFCFVFSFSFSVLHFRAAIIVFVCCMCSSGPFFVCCICISSFCFRVLRSSATVVLQTMYRQCLGLSIVTFRFCFKRSLEYLSPHSRVPGFISHTPL